MARRMWRSGLETDKGERNEGQRHSAVKGNALFAVAPENTLWLAVQTMAENDIGSVVVIDHGVLVGCSLSAKSSSACMRTRVRSATSCEHGHGRGALVVTPETDVNDVRRLMLERHTRYLPVLEVRR